LLLVAHACLFIATATTEIYTFPTRRSSDLVKLFEAGEPNELLFRMIRQNTRVPDQVVGDIMAQVAANELAARRLIGHARVQADQDRKSTRLNSSHVKISYAVFCLENKTTDS